MTYNDPQTLHRHYKDRATLTPLKTGSELMCSGKVGSSCSTVYFICEIFVMQILTENCKIYNEKGKNITQLE